MNESLTKGTAYGEARFRNGLVLRHPPDRTGFVRMMLEVFFEQVYTGNFYRPKPGDVIIDAGANVGTFSVHAHLLEPGCQVYAFEPFSENFDILKRNVEMNSIDNVHVFQEAVSGTCQRVELVAHGNRSQDHRVGKSGNLSKDIETVPSANLKRILEIVSVDTIAFFKCDIEGSERELFASATPDEISRVKMFAIEFHDNIAAGACETIESALRSTHVVRFGAVSPHGYGMIYAVRK